MSKLDELGKKKKYTKNYCRNENHPFLDVIHIYDDGKKLWQCRKCGGFFPSGIPSEEYQKGFFEGMRQARLEEREAMKKKIEIKARALLKQFGVNTPFVGAPILNREELINLIMKIEV